MRISLYHFVGMVGLLTLLSCSSKQMPSMIEPEHISAQTRQRKTTPMDTSKTEPKYKDTQVMMPCSSKEILDKTGSPDTQIYSKETLPTCKNIEQTRTQPTMSWSSKQMSSMTDPEHIDAQTCQRETTPMDKSKTEPTSTVLNKAESNTLKKNDSPASGDKDYYIIRVFFATDRNPIEIKENNQCFGNNRAQTISYGTCTVSIPRDHRMGELETPSWWKLEFLDAPSKHIVLLSTLSKEKKQFFTDMIDLIRKSKGKKAFIFIHGYNVTFEDAAKRTAQIAYDLNFDGAPVFYSWPSQGTFDYIVDEQNIEWAQTDLNFFLNDFFEKSGAQNIYLIAHSMGNRALTRAVASLLANPTFKSRLKEVILAAPDIDAEVFRRDIAPALSVPGNPVTTLYASSKDIALVASRKVHGSPRAGDSGDGLIVVPGIETIDVTNVDTSFFGHSYYAENTSIISDIFYVLQGLNADQRSLLHKVETQNGCYWAFKK